MSMGEHGHGVGSVGKACGAGAVYGVELDFLGLWAAEARAMATAMR